MRSCSILLVLAAGCVEPTVSMPPPPVPRAARAEAEEPVGGADPGAPGAPGEEVASESAGERLSSTLLLVSIDGFRADYLELHEAPNLARFVEEGVRAEHLEAVFPSKTFPSHYSIVTGLWPEHHGVVDNTMYDPELDAWFRIGDAEAVTDGRWWGGEPIWVTAERQGLRAATLFWPGSEAPIGPAGVRPTHWTPYDDSMPGRERVDLVLAWLAQDEDERPDFVTLYFSAVDSAGHRHGPESEEVAAAVRSVDAHLGDLFAGLAIHGLEDVVDVVIVSDHGMIERSRERMIVLEDLLGEESEELLAGARIVTYSPVLGIRGLDEAQDRALVEGLRAADHPHLSVWPRERVPAELHWSEHPRIPPVVAVADPGWAIVNRASVEALSRRPPGANHGYDPRHPSMHAFLAARGPAFRTGATVEPVRIVDLYPLFCRLLGLEAAPHDGDRFATRRMLKPRRRIGR